MVGKESLTGHSGGESSGALARDLDLRRLKKAKEEKEPNR